MCLTQLLFLESLIFCNSNAAEMNKKKRWIQLRVKFAHFLKGLRMGAVIDRFKNFRAGSADYDEDDDNDADVGAIRVDMDKVLDELNPFGWFQVREKVMMLCHSRLSMCCRQGLCYLIFL